MGYRSLVIQKVRTAFNTIKDLAVDVTLTQSSPTGYNFATNQLVGASTATTTIKGVLLESDREEVENKIAGKLLLKSEDVSDLTIYDSLVINGITWNIVPPYKDNGYTIEVEIAREG